MLHIRPLGICSRFADRGLSVFVIKGPAPAAESPGKFKLRHNRIPTVKQVCSHNAGRMVSPITVAVVAEDARGSSAKIEMEAARRVMQ